MEKVRVGWVGLGQRGYGLLEMVIKYLGEKVEVVGVCDLYEDRTEAGRKLVEDLTGVSPEAVLDYRRLLERKDIDAIVAPAAWEAHTDIFIDSMLAGKYVGVEVGGAYSIEQCWDIVRTYERTKVPCMMLENCCYGEEEMTVLNMIKKGMFGELIHCEGGYRHDLRDEIAQGNEIRHYRLRNYMNRCGELYPTHELGPIAKYLDINRGNRMVSLTSMASKSAGIQEWIRAYRPDDPNGRYNFAQGDIVTTMIKCAHGETITLTHDTSLPRPYTRGNLVQGTRGIWSEDKHGMMFDGMLDTPSYEHKFIPYEEFSKDHIHPLHKNYKVVGGHGGMDYLVFDAFFEAVRNRTQTPIDAYDTAAWMSITPLSEASIACGSMPVAIPDFTNGKWTHREPIVRSKYCLDAVCEEFFE